jgi:hypothetical protein
MRQALNPPPTKVVMEESAGRCSQMDGLSPKPKIASIIRGITQSEPDVSRAKSNPLTESLMPAQLTCSQGRKKQRRINPAMLKVSFRAFFTRIALKPIRRSRSGLYFGKKLVRIR